MPMTLVQRSTENNLSSKQPVRTDATLQGWVMQDVQQSTEPKQLDSLLSMALQH